MRAEHRWAQSLVDMVAQGLTPPPTVVAGFAAHYLQLAEVSDRVHEATAQHLELRASHTTLRDTVAREQLLVAAQDIRAGLHMSGQPTLSVHVHASGELAVLVGTCVSKNEETGEWDESVAYRMLTGPHQGRLCVNILQRWDDRWTSHPDPAL